MTTFTPTSSIVGPGTAFSVGGVGDSLLVLEGINLVSTGTTAVVAYSESTVTVHGTVHGDLNGIALGEEVYGGNVFIGDTGNVGASNGVAIYGAASGQYGDIDYSIINNGDVNSFGLDPTIRLEGKGANVDGLWGDLEVVNNGLIANQLPGEGGPAIRLTDAGETGSIYNGEAGLITAIGKRPTIEVTGTQYGEIGDTVTQFDFFNAGEVDSDEIAYASTGFGTDTVTNTGLIKGDILLGMNDDVFDGRGGHVDGTVYGGRGADVYIVDDSGASLFEASGEGVDEVRSEADFTLADFFEHLTLLGTEDIDGTGNNYQNVVTGNAGDNKLFGHGSRDTIDGGLGDDTVDGGRGNDELYGSSGDDRLNGHAGNDLMLGGEDDDYLFGGVGNDQMFGEDGNDTMKGGLGSDTMDGGAGQDVFVFTKVSDSPTGGSDRIDNYVVGEDSIDVTGLVSGTLDVNILGSLTGGGQASLRTFENSFGDTVVFVDADGDGSSDMRIEVDGVIGLTEADFMV